MTCLRAQIGHDSSVIRGSARTSRMHVRVAHSLSYQSSITPRNVVASLRRRGALCDGRILCTHHRFSRGHVRTARLPILPLLVLSLGLTALGCGSQEGGPQWSDGEDENLGSVSQPLVYTPRGPGFGNLTYNSGELMQRISLVNSANGVPSEYQGLNLGYMFNGYFVGVAARDHGWSGGAWVVLNVSNPRSPTSVVTLNDSACTGSGDCFYNGHLNGVQNPGRPGLTGDFRELHGACFTIMNNRWYAAIPSGYGIEVWDFTDVNTGVAPTRTSKFAIPGIKAGDYTDTSWQLTCEAPYVYVANANQGISVISIANPSSPLLLSRTP